MNARFLRRFHPLLVSLLIFVAADANAFDPRLVLEDDQGFCTSLRNVDKENLVSRLEQNRSRLAEQQSQLLKRLENLKFSKLDALITLVMPGGLIYAAIKRESSRQERKRFEQMSQVLTQLNGELLALSPEDTGKTLAFK